MSDAWLSCSECKQPIGFGRTYWLCSVSTCQKSKLRLVYCSVACWDSHLSETPHREAWAVEATSPRKDEWLAAGGHAGAAAGAATGGGGAAPVRRVVPPPAIATAAASDLGGDYERDVLIVVSKLKKYIRDRSGMNTSDGVIDKLSDHVRAICDGAIRTAGRDGRKTVMDRDLPPIGDGS